MHPRTCLVHLSLAFTKYRDSLALCFLLYFFPAYSFSPFILHACLSLTPPLPRLLRPSHQACLMELFLAS
jgi:hypothetical protein